jgi:hypothetical protein
MGIAQGGLFWTRDCIPWDYVGPPEFQVLYNFDGLRWLPTPFIGLDFFAPLWLLFLGFIAYPVFVLAENRARRRWRTVLCPKCSYNLIGNVSGVCPECGREAV